eukprot:g36713.t1
MTERVSGTWSCAGKYTLGSCNSIYQMSKVWPYPYSKPRTRIIRHLSKERAVGEIQPRMKPYWLRTLSEAAQVTANVSDTLLRQTSHYRFRKVIISHMIWRSVDVVEVGVPGTQVCTLVLRKKNTYITWSEVPDVSAEEKYALLYYETVECVIRFQTGSTE